MNPVTFLAIASIESEGNASKVDISGTAYGIVQITEWYLNPYNCAHDTDYTLTDLIGQGPNVTTLTEAVAVSFDILGELMKTFNQASNSFKLTATAWNGPGCGQNGYLYPWGASCGGIKNPANVTCYGEAAYKIASSHAPYWIDPNTNQPNSFYFGDLNPVTPCTNDNITICLG